MLQVSAWVSYCLHLQVPGLEFLFFLWVLLQCRLHIHQLLSSIKWWARWTTRSSGLSFLCFSQVALVRVSLEVEMCCMSLSDGNDKLFVDKVHSLSDHHFHIYLHGSSGSNVLESIDALWGPDSEVKQNSTFDVCGCAGTRKCLCSRNICSWAIPPAAFWAWLQCMSLYLALC